MKNRVGKDQLAQALRNNLSRRKAQARGTAPLPARQGPGEEQTNGGDTARVSPDGGTHPMPAPLEGGEEA